MKVLIETPYGKLHAGSVRSAKNFCDMQTKEESIRSGANLVSTITGQDVITMTCNKKIWKIHINENKQHTR